MLEDDNTAAETYELYGPSNYSMAEIAELVDKEIFKRRRHLNVPKTIMQPTAKVLNQLLWWKTTSADEIEREFLDQVIDPKAKTFADLEITPGELANFTFHYLVSRLHISSMKAMKMLIWSFSNSKDTEVQRSTICPQQQSEKNGRKKGTCM